MIFLVLVSSCISKSGKNNEQIKDSINSRTNMDQTNTKSYENLDFAKTSSKTDTSTFWLIDKTMAIILLPDSTWSNGQQKQMGEDSWNEVVADHDYYQSEAMEALEKKGIEVKFFDPHKRYFKFLKKDKSEYFIDNFKMKDRWGLILFNIEGNPVFWSNTMINDAIIDIYKK